MKAFTKVELMNSLKIIVLGLVFGFGVGAVQGAGTWTGPSGTPTNCPSGYAGCDAPLHVGASGQIKTGGLSIGGGLGSTDLGLGILGGRVGIGTSNPTEKLDVVGNVKGTKLCIASDCRDAWPSGGSSGGLSGSGVSGRLVKFTGSTSVGNANIYASDDNLNFGFNQGNPQATVDINGSFRLRGNNAASGKVLTTDGSGGVGAWEYAAVLCSNSSNAAPCNAAETDSGRGTNQWRVVNCLGQSNTTFVTAQVIRYNGNWQQWNDGAGWTNCQDGSALVVRVGAVL